ncbi:MULTISPECIES: MarR family winged helix-turn-helix transcriptional regulator [Actinopolyspora]|uniref:DNA-binding transcriptional regulator, MarR family n=1 Tax=Actinopolyspora saharensis TaxID=995062 RepID=A0A1H0Z3H3_9ACTN|nr:MULTISPECIES: MarR family winged helix-turn-helix transcriptional regulator [Actinopolyspora]NHD16067.1 winged helix-turn-helix transcriptional regulator [Actinopolyspora sp. BKK2]NHE74719.1 winged helix-turn-helix transcriptional regulator [Actinopolyspora sp. BKK1]SDQ21701.1 DNA-binding transcriptional regulator, MarR family [Actinopolyspora saharensis]
MTVAANMPVDGVEATVQRWGAQRPDLDVSPIAVIGWLTTASRQIERRLSAVLTEYDLQSWEFDVLATLRTDGEPYEMCPGTIGGHLRVSNSAMTNRINRLEEAGLVERHFSPHNRRIIIIRLTEQGVEVTNRAMNAYLAEGRNALEALSREEVDQLCGLLRKLSTETTAESE